MKPELEPNIILARPCAEGRAGCPADKVPCERCKTLCWLSHSTKQDAEDLNEPYVVVCYECCKLREPEVIFVGDRTLVDAIEAILGSPPDKLN